MKKFSSIGAVVFAVLIVGLAILGFSAPAQAYPDEQISVTVSSDTVYVGETFTATAKSGSTTCSWRLEWNGKVQTGTSSGDQAFTATFRAPHVSRTTKIPLNATCDYTATTGRSAQWSRTIEITVKPRHESVSPPGGSSAGNGSFGAGGNAAGGTAASGGTSASSHGSHLPNTGSDLPNTGGPNMLILVGGLVLLLSGATAVTVARRRAEEAEIQASRA